MIYAVAALGALVGAVTGLVGAGGGIIAVPSLVYIAGVPLPTAVSTSLIMGALAPLGAIIPRLRGGVDWRTAGAVVLSGIPAAFAGTFAGSLLPDEIVLVSFAALMLVAGAQMLRGRHAGGKEHPVRPRLWTLRALGVGVAVGFLTGLLGVGGGFITVPALVALLGLPLRLAIGTSLVVTVVNALAGIAAHASVTQPDWAIALAFGIPSVIVAFASGLVARRLPERVLRVCFATLVLLAGVGTAMQAVLGIMTAA
ncbi:sulfite exporter TauE/SafE family protein [Microbacterium sp.]|uniref:sulfite exporter TauE/SafE family protein n=1 Tax=Microbacterium sp. TaxID=51671 RepID=UPI0035638F7D